MLIVILLAYNIYSGFKTISEEYYLNYSSALETAEYIEQNIENDAMFICTNMPKSSAVIPYTSNYKYWSPQTKNYFSFVSWNEDYENTYTVQEFKDMVENFEEENLYFLYTYDWKDEIINDFEEEGYIELIFESNDSIKDENYRIYKINN